MGNSGKGVVIPFQPAPRPSKAELAVYSLLVTGKPTREESRLAVRHLLKQASGNLERSR